MSNYISNNELQTFDFNEAVLGEISLSAGAFTMYLDNVKILAKNHNNTDIRMMRGNEMELSITNASILSVTEEGYKVYDADGNLTTTVNDRLVDKADYSSEFEQLRGCTLYEIVQKDDHYDIAIDTEDHSYLIQVTGDSNIVKWDKFLNV